MHTPLLQVLPVPHAVPFGTLPVATHVCAPEEHEVVPSWQRLPPGVHAAPAVHATHIPMLHTSFAPHDVPFGAFVSMVHAGMPPEHAVTPT